VKKFIYPNIGVCVLVVGNNDGIMESLGCCIIIRRRGEERRREGGEEKEDRRRKE